MTTSNRITENTVELVRFRQKVREAMRRHGLTEITDDVYSKGDVIEGKMAVVSLAIASDSTDSDIAAAAANAAETYANAIRRGPK